jgi:hypothetical protein
LAKKIASKIADFRPSGVIDTAETCTLHSGAIEIAVQPTLLIF